MRKFLLIALSFFISSSVWANEVSNLSAGEALQKLKDGNKRFVEMHLKHPDDNKDRRNELVKGQHPFAAILSCSDSRVADELIFDQGLGDLFVIRNAGNVLDDHVIGSIEYAVYHLGVKLVVIMGHQSCGAVAATMQGGADTHYIKTLEDAIAPAVNLCEKQHNLNPDDVAKTHAILDVEDLLKEDSKLKDFVEKHDVKIVPAYYHLDSGKVDFIK